MEKTTLILIAIIMMTGVLAIPYIRNHLLRIREAESDMDGCAAVLPGAVSGTIRESETVRKTSATAQVLERVLRRAEEKVAAAVGVAVQETERAKKQCTDIVTGAKKLYETAMESGFYSVDLVENAKTECDQAVMAEKQTEEILMLMRELFEISMETNKLAMNISIEAARAGERGKRIGQSAYEIRMLVERSKRTAGKMSKEMREIRKSVTGIAASSERFLSLMDHKVLVDHDSFIFTAERYMEDARLYRQGAVGSNDSVKKVEEELRELGKAVDSVSVWLQTIGENGNRGRGDLTGSDGPVLVGMADLEESSRRLSEMVAAFRVKN
ncbi:methyl-accepting chemotaxis protein [Lachnospiraceae bacterium JLR.KK008]